MATRTAGQRKRGPGRPRKPTFEELTHQLGMARFRLAHPEKYVVDGRYTREQTRALRARIAELEAAREEIRPVTRGPHATKAAA